MAFARILAERYIWSMSRQRSPGKTFFVRAAIAAAAVGGFSGVAFAAWVENGSAMLLTLAATGMSWCF
jgi:hypothetical protein